MRNLNSFNKNIFYFLFSKLIIFCLFYEINSETKSESNIAVIPFKSYFPIDYSENDQIIQLISSWAFRKIYLNVEVTSGQKIAMFLNFEQVQIHTSEIIALSSNDDERYSKRYNQNCSHICSYDYESSYSYSNYSDVVKRFRSLYAWTASEKMIFYKDINNKRKSLYEFKFLHTSNGTHITNPICLLTGLKDTNSPIDKQESLFYQIKDLIKSKKFTWSFYFKGPNEGNFIIGDIIGNSDLKFYNENKMENYITIYFEYVFTDRIYWRLTPEKIYIGNYVAENVKPFDVIFHNRYISVNQDCFKEIKKQYLLDKAIANGYCREVTNDYYYVSIFCDKSKYLSLSDNYNKLNDFIISLYLKDEKENITFTPKDLFMEKGDKIYFFIREDRKSDYFTVGSLFLEKYITVFDDEAKQLYILKRKVEPKEPEKDNTALKIVLIVFLSFVFCGIIFVVIGKFYGKKLFATRKKKANELDDDYFDYTPQSINNGKNNNDALMDDNSEENGGINGK